MVSIDSENLSDTATDLGEQPWCDLFVGEDWFSSHSRVVPHHSQSRIALQHSRWQSVLDELI